MVYRSIEQSRAARVAYHLAPADAWEAQRMTGSYRPETFDQDGFVHATNGLDRLLWVANEFYARDPRPHTVLVINVSSLRSPVRYDDPGEAFPHIYGPLNADAVIGELAVQRGDNGVYISFGRELV